MNHQHFSPCIKRGSSYRYEHDDARPAVGGALDDAFPCGEGAHDNREPAMILERANSDELELLVQPV